MRQLCLLILLQVFFFPRYAMAQQTHGAENRCAFDEVRLEIQRAVPSLKATESAINQRTADWIRDHADEARQSRYFPNGPDFIIPIVVHVVHNGEPVGSGTNISYTQIRSQIDALNAGFSRYDGSFTYYQSAAGAQFAGLSIAPPAVDTRIRFCLATNPGNGQAWTNATEPGVMRYNSAADSRHEYSVAGQTAIANLTQPGAAFPSTSYLNIWVVTSIRFGGAPQSGDCPGIQGYAQLAGYTGPAIRILDGVVIRSDVFGDNFITGNSFNLQPNPNPACPNGANGYQGDQGRILVHEVGHFLGLYHTFHECQTSLPGFCSLTGDLVCDTNPCDQPGASTGCGPSDMPQNFMYYSPDPVLTTFTAGQRERMHAILNSTRASLVSESNVFATGLLGPAGCFAGAVIPDFTMPNVICVGTAASFANIGQGTPANLANQWQWTVVPAAGATIASPNAAVTDITFTGSGNYTVRLTVSQSGTQVRFYEQSVQAVPCALQECRKDQQKWIFGWGYVGIDFSDGTPVPFVPTPMDSILDDNQESYVTITNPRTGEIEFYTNGINVYDGAFNQVNTSSLHPLAGGIYNSSAQMLCVPNPGHAGQYVLIVPNRGYNDPIIIGVAPDYPSHSAFIIDTTGPLTVTPYPCVFNFTGPTGVSFNFNQNSSNEQITAVPHANGRDYWIVFPICSVNGAVYLVSMLLSPSGITQRDVRFMANGALLTAGQGIVASPSHNRLALKYRSGGNNFSIVTCGFDNGNGLFTGSPVTYDVDIYNVPTPGGLIFYDDTHIYLSRTGGFPNTGILDMDLLTGQVTDIATGVHYGRFSYGPDGEVYTLFKPRSYGAGSNGLARIDRVAGSAVATQVIPALQLTPTLPITVGINFWNMQETYICPPSMASTEFIITRISCNSFQFHLRDSARWSGQQVRWDFGDGSPPQTISATIAATHTYGGSGTFTVSMQMTETGCAGNFLYPVIPETGQLQVFDPNQPLPVSGPAIICLRSDTRDFTYSTTAVPGAVYTWTLAGDGQVRQPSAGPDVNQVQVLFGTGPGVRTLAVQVSDAGCSLSGSITVTGILPGQANAGQNGQISICAGQQSAVNLFDLITGEQPGGYWTQLSGSGGNFNAAAGTYTPVPGATTSIFQYIIPEQAGCNTPDTSEAVVQILNSAAAGIDGSAALCLSAGGTVDLFGLISGESSGGVWERVSGTGGNFDAAVGTFVITATATSSTFRYVVTGTGGCSNDSSLAIVSIDAPVNAGTDGQLDICDLNRTYSLGTAIAGYQPGGIWTRLSGTGGVFDPSTGTLGPVFSPGVNVFQYRLPANGACPADEATVTVNVGGFDPLNDTDTSICGGTSIDLNRLYDLSPYVIVRNWAVNGSLVTDASAVNESGLYELIIGNNGFCFDTVRVKLRVLAPVSANAGQDTVAVYNQPMTLSGSGNGLFSWTWTPANAVVSNPASPRPVVRLTEPEYLFILRITNAAGCEGIDSVRIKVFKGPAYYVPNAFTPNSDGLNDLFSALPVGIRKTDWFRVYNRYGQLVFETTEPTRGWDGRFLGKPQDSGTFTWVIKGVGFNSRAVESKGTVVLIR